METPSKYYGLLAVSIVAEVIGTTLMKLSEGFTDPLYSLGTIVAYVISFGIFVVVLKYVQLGFAYGIWGGIGTAITTVIGCVGWGEPFTLFTGVGVVLIVGGIILMNAGVQDAEKTAERGNEASA